MSTITITDRIAAEAIRLIDRILDWFDWLDCELYRLFVAKK